MHYPLKVSHNSKSSLCHIVREVSSQSCDTPLPKGKNQAKWMTAADQLAIDSSVAACLWSKILEGIGSARGHRQT